MIILHNFHGYCASTDLYPTIDWSMAPLHGNKPLHIETSSILTVIRQRIIELKQSNIELSEVRC